MIPENPVAGHLRKTLIGRRLPGSGGTLPPGWEVVLRALLIRPMLPAVDDAAWRPGMAMGRDNLESLELQPHMAEISQVLADVEFVAICQNVDLRFRLEAAERLRRKLVTVTTEAGQAGWVTVSASMLPFDGLTRLAERPLAGVFLRKKSAPDCIAFTNRYYRVNQLDQFSRIF